MSEPAPDQRAGFLKALTRGPLLADAAMGTRLIAQGLDLASDDPALWNLTHPEAVAEVHRRDRAAGAQVLLTNTFGANRVWLARFGRAGEVAEINRRAVELARIAAHEAEFAPDSAAYVLGSIGPTASGFPGAYEEQIEALCEAGVDALLFETHLLNEALGGLRAARGRTDLPIVVSLLIWPVPLYETTAELADNGARVLGANCMEGMWKAFLLARRLREVTSLPLVMKPNAGPPGREPVSPASFAEHVPGLLRCRVRLLGGCCGTDERHLAALAQALASQARAPA